MLPRKFLLGVLRRKLATNVEALLVGGKRRLAGDPARAASCDAAARCALALTKLGTFSNPDW